MIYLSIVAVFLPLLVLVAMISRSLYSNPDDPNLALSGSDAIAPDDRLDDSGDTLYLEILLRTFSEDDQRFVATLGDTHVQRLLQFERKRIALGWIHRKKAEARSIMHEHVSRAKALRDLKASSEFRLVFQYIGLLAMCQLLVLLVFFFGPSRLQGLAIQTNGILVGLRRAGAVAA
jgi:hypothetical protein